MRDFVTDRAVITYKVLAASSAGMLAEDVMAAIDEGFKPIGGVSVSGYQEEKGGGLDGSFTNFIYAQAVWKDLK